MCGRYALARRADALARFFRATEGPALRQHYQPSFNIAPTRQVVGLAQTAEGVRVLDTYRWGLVPAWARDPSIGNRLFNARAATLATTPAFRDAYWARRLAVLADGFFEWQTAPDGRRWPLYFQRSDGAPLALAGLWEAWRDPRDAREEHLFSCTIITTEAGIDMAGCHDRMPVVLEAEVLDLWLDGAYGNRPAPAELLYPPPAGTLVRHPVDPRVGDVRNDGPELIAPFDDQPLRLFD